MRKKLVNMKDFDPFDRFLVYLFIASAVLHVIASAWFQDPLHIWRAAVDLVTAYLVYRFYYWKTAYYQERFTHTGVKAPWKKGGVK